MLDFLAVADIEACDRPFFLSLIGVDFELFSRDLDVFVDIVSEFFAVGVHGVDGGVVILILIRLNSTSVLFVSDQLDFGNLLAADLVLN